MKYLKYYESISEIDRICKKYGIGYYHINSDGSIDVEYDVNLANVELTKFPIRFNHIDGDFDCSENNLTTLEGAPKSVRGNFNCFGNKLTSLEGAPESVDGDFNCYVNKLTTLEGAPEYVGGGFDCSLNQLTSLEGAPEYVGGEFDCRFNENLTTLNGAPLSIGKEFKCDETPVYSVWELFKDKNELTTFNYYDIIRDKSTISLYRLNVFLEELGKPPVESVKGYTMI